MLPPGVVSIFMMALMRTQSPTARPRVWLGSLRPSLTVRVSLSLPPRAISHELMR